jgi:hypothetical protein
MRDHSKLKVFELADQLALLIYRSTFGFPKTERYGLQSQVRRAAVSIGANIVEGCTNLSERVCAIHRDRLRLRERTAVRSRFMPTTWILHRVPGKRT